MTRRRSPLVKRKYEIGERVWVRIYGQDYELLAEVVGHEGSSVVVLFVDQQTTIPHPEHPNGFAVWRCWHKTEMQQKDFKIVRRA